MITGTSFNDNGVNGVFIDSNSGFDRETAYPSFTDNILNRNVEYPITLPADYIGDLDPSSDFTLNTQDFIHTNTGGVTTTASWFNHGMPYLITHNIIVQDNTDGVTLTIDDGNSVYFGNNRTMHVGQSYDGTLIVNGDTDGVLFTSQAEVGPGDWYGLNMYAHSTGSSLIGLTVLNGGGSTSYAGNLSLTSTSPLIQDCTFSYSELSGLRLNSGAFPLITGSTFTNNITYGILFESGSGLTRGENPTFINNTLSDNDIPIAINSDFLGELDSSSTFSGNTNDEIKILNGSVKADALWQKHDVPYHSSVSLDVQENDDDGTTLEIEDGVNIFFDANRNFSIGTSYDATFTVQGLIEGVLFTSAAETPTEGDWGGLQIRGHSTVDIDGVTVSYGGGSSSYPGGIYINNSSPRIQNCTITHSELDGITINGTSTPYITGTTVSDNLRSGIVNNYAFPHSPSPSFTDNTLINNGEYPIKVKPEYAGELDVSSTFTPNGMDQIYLFGGNVLTDASWQDLGIPYYSAGNITVEDNTDGVTLTIEDNVTIRFSPVHYLAVGTSYDGNLIVDGNTNGVTFTGNSETPAAGDWIGLRLNGHSDPSTLTGLTVEYGGSSTSYPGNIHILGSSPVLDGCTITDSARKGIYISSSCYPTIRNSDISNNQEEGIYNYGGFTREADPGFTNNILTGNGTYPIAINAEFVGELDATSDFSGNTDDFIMLTGGNITTSATWQKQNVPYYVSQSLALQDNVDGVTIDIDDGASFYFAENRQFAIGQSYPGVLRVNGDTEGVIFSSIAETPAPGDWIGLIFFNHSDGSSMNEATVAYAGRSGSYVGGIYLSNTQVTVSNSRVTRSSKNGIYLASSSELSLGGSEIDNNALTGLVVNNGTTLASGTFDRNNFHDNGEYPVSIYPNHIPELDTDTSYDQNSKDYIHIRSGSVIDDAIWPLLDVPYLVDGTVTVQDNTDGVLLQIAESVTIAFNTNGTFEIGTSYPGALQAIGGSSTPITFTSVQDTKTAGDWRGIRYQNSCVDSESILRNVIVEYGGSNANGNVTFVNCDGTLADAQIKHSSSWGVYAAAPANPTLGTITYTSNASGDLYQ